MACCCCWSKSCIGKDKQLGNYDIKGEDGGISKAGDNQQLNSFSNQTSTQSKGANNNNTNANNKKEEEKDKLSFNESMSLPSSSSRKYSFISSKKKQMPIDNSRGLLNSNSFMSESKSNHDTNDKHKSISSNLSCSCEQILSLKDKRLKLNENEVLLSNIILDEEIALAPKLSIEDLNGTLLKGDRLNIDAAGLYNSIRKKRDGIVFFGLSKSNHNNNNNNSNDNILLNANDTVNPFSGHETNESLNDYNLNYTNPNCNLNRLFMIYYHRNTVTYFLKSFINEILTSNVMLTLKVTQPYVINKKTFVILGNIMMIIDFDTLSLDKQEDMHKSINISIKYPKNKDIDMGIGSNSIKEYRYNVNDCSNVTIGRESCTINLDNKYYSKPHCSVYYNSFKSQWELCDGDSLGHKGSTHGTWVLIQSELSLGEYDEYIIRLNKQTIRISKEQD